MLQLRSSSTESEEDDEMAAADDSTFFLERSICAISNFLSAKSLLDQMKVHEKIVNDVVLLLRVLLMTKIGSFC